MAGRLLDLADPATVLPDRIVIDSSITIDWLVAVTQLAAGAIPTPGQRRAVGLFDTLQTNSAVGLVTSTSFNEVFHFVVKAHFRAALPHHQSDLQRRYSNVRRHCWEHLYKARSDLLKQFAPEFERVRQLLIAGGLLFLQSGDLDDLPAGRSRDEAMLGTMTRYELDTSDASILLEAQQAGVPRLATADPDLRRAALDFDVYTWP